MCMLGHIDGDECVGIQETNLSINDPCMSSCLLHRLRSGTRRAGRRESWHKLYGMTKTLCYGHELEYKTAGCGGFFLDIYLPLFRHFCSIVLLATL